MLYGSIDSVVKLMTCEGTLKPNSAPLLPHKTSHWEREKGPVCPEFCTMNDSEKNEQPQVSLIRS